MQLQLWMVVRIKRCKSKRTISKQKKTVNKTKKLTIFTLLWFFLFCFKEIISGVVLSPTPKQTSSHLWSFFGSNHPANTCFFVAKCALFITGTIFLRHAASLPRVKMTLASVLSVFPRSRRPSILSERKQLSVTS